MKEEIKETLIELSCTLGIAIVFGWVQALASALLGESLATAIILYMLANCIYKGLKK